MAATSVLTKKQVRKYGPRKFTEAGRNYQITAEVRYEGCTKPLVKEKEHEAIHCNNQVLDSFDGRGL